MMLALGFFICLTIVQGVCLYLTNKAHNKAIEGAIVRLNKQQSDNNDTIDLIKEQNKTLSEMNDRITAVSFEVHNKR